MSTDHPTASEIAAFLRDGVVLLDPRFDPETVRRARSEVDRLLPAQPGCVRSGATCSFFEPALNELISHPYLESAAQQALDAPEVGLYQTAVTKVAPEPGATWSFEQHTDIDYRLADWQSSPRRIICSFFIWLTDVNEKRAPMMCRPGSHLLLAQDRQQKNDRLRQQPQVRGTGFDQLPDLAYAPATPITARAGQVTMVTTALVHGASVNVDTDDRCALVVTFTAAGVRIGLPLDQEHQRRSYLRKLAGLLPDHRRHIAVI